MRTSVLLSLLSAAVVIASDPAYVDRNIAYAVCTSTNAATACTTVNTAWGDAQCATVTTRLTAAGTPAYTALQCLPRAALFSGQVTIGGHFVTITNASALTGTAPTACTSQSSCDASSCCVQTSHTVNGTSVGTSMFCGARTSFLDAGLQSTVGASSTPATASNTISI